MKGFAENQLTKGYCRRLEALRKSLGTDIADDAFAKWFSRQTKPVPEDRNAVAEAFMPLIEQGKLRISRGGVRRGRVIADPVKEPRNDVLDGQQQPPAR